MTASRRWSEGLAAWAIPEHILDAAPVSPYEFPVKVFDRAAADAVGRDTPSRRRALEALPDGGSVLDVGCGAGAASLPLVPPASRLAGVDEGARMLEAFAERAETTGVAHTEIEGRWPDVAARVPPADVVVCHHVFWNVPDLDRFAQALDAHARARVVVELTEIHPLSWLNPLWQELHGIKRPDRPTADDAVEVLREIGLSPQVERSEAPMHLAKHLDDHRNATVASVRRRLCLGPERDPDVADAIDRHPVPATRNFVTVWWDT